MLNVNLVKVATVAGSVLSLAGTAISAWANSKVTEEKIAKQVEEALKNLK